MKRIAVHFSDDITEQEIATMARDHGFVARHINGATVIDRVPNWLRDTGATLITNVVPLAGTRKKAARG